MTDSRRHTRVFILAQGQQRRLPTLEIPKQMLKLPACNNTRIIDRTLCQLAMLLPGVQVARSVDEYVDTSFAHVTVICGGMLADHVGDPLGKRRVWEATQRVLHIDDLELHDPGNSSLKGIHRTFVWQDFWNRPRREQDQTIVLLGDVVYSWECLEKIIAAPLYRQGDVRFVGTKDLDPGHGELWGLTWCWSRTTMMRAALDDAMARHPPYADYQPGQMRRWLWAVDRCEGLFGDGFPARERTRSWFQACDDYTRDIDLPKHVELLGELGELAAADDREHGLHWRTT